jgi:uncharacterized protein (TIGR02217 family)
MAFHDVRFPTDIAYGSSGGPEFSTDVVMLASGYEQRNSNWPSARAKFNVAHGVKTQAQLDVLLAFFRARQGRAHSFRFKDWTDYKVTGQTLGTGTGALTTFPLIKSYTSGGVTHTRSLTKPVSGTVNIYLAGVLQSSGFSVNLTTGIVTFVTPPANGLVVAADAEFDIPARFDTDRLSASMDSYGSFSWADIPVVEVRG